MKAICLIRTGPCGIGSFVCMAERRASACEYEYIAVFLLMEFMILIKSLTFDPSNRRPLSLKIYVNPRRGKGRFALIIALRGVVAAP